VSLARLLRNFQLCWEYHGGLTVKIWEIRSRGYRNYANVSYSACKLPQNFSAPYALDAKTFWRCKNGIRISVFVFFYFTGSMRATHIRRYFGYSWHILSFFCPRGGDTLHWLGEVWRMSTLSRHMSSRSVQKWVYDPKTENFIKFLNINTLGRLLRNFEYLYGVLWSRGCGVMRVYSWGCVSPKIFSAP